MPASGSPVLAHCMGLSFALLSSLHCFPLAVYSNRLRKTHTPTLDSFNILLKIPGSTRSRGLFLNPDDSKSLSSVELLKVTPSTTVWASDHIFQGYFVANPICDLQIQHRMSSFCHWCCLGTEYKAVELKTEIPLWNSAGIIASIRDLLFCCQGFNQEPLQISFAQRSSPGGRKRECDPASLSVSLSGLWYHRALDPPGLALGVSGIALSWFDI